MLELRPICENCGVSLPPESIEAMICSFECTFCRKCFQELLENVCPNCGGGLVLRPIRPKNNWKDENYLGKYPAGIKEKLCPVAPEVHKRFADNIKRISPEKR